MNRMTEIVLVPSLQIRYEIVNVHRVRLEGSSGREMEISDDFVDANLSGDVAAFFLLLFDLVGPSFAHALSSSDFEIISCDSTMNERTRLTCSTASGLTKLHPLLTYDSLTSSHELQHPGFGPSVGGVPPKHDKQTANESCQS